MKILYIHGYGSNTRDISTSEKHTQLREFFGGSTVEYLAPNYDKGFLFVKETLLKKYNDFKPNLIVGCSMGGLSASYLGSLTGTPFVALNPVIDPTRVKQADLSELGYLMFMTPDLYQVFVTEDDEIIDFTETVKYFTDKGESKKVTVIKEGGHSFSNLLQIQIEVEIFMDMIGFMSGDNGNFCND